MSERDVVDPRGGGDSRLERAIAFLNQACSAADVEVFDPEDEEDGAA